jgi:hypothetical protein
VGVPTLVHDINSVGQIVGSGPSTLAPYHEAGLRWQPQVEELVGSLGDFGVRLEAVAINDNSVAIGHIVTSFGRHEPVLWTADRQMISLTTPTTIDEALVYDINSSSWIVSEAVIGTARHAYAYSAEDGWTDLQARVFGVGNWQLTRAVALNDSGVIVGTGIRDGVETGFRLTPAPPTLGDIDHNGFWNCADINALTQGIAAGTFDAALDLNADLRVDALDLAVWREFAGARNLASGGAYLEGDANLDGVVDGQDFVEWNANKFTATAAWCAGDFNADGLVDGQDFLLWNANKFTSADNSGTVAVPESLGPLGLGTTFGLLVLARRRISG